MTEELLVKVNPSLLRDVMQEAGHRAELVEEAGSPPLVHSASGGVFFDVRWSTADQEDAADNFFFLAGLRVEREIPAEILNSWNTTRRFARLRVLPEMLVMHMDVLLAGGVSRAHLRAQIELWVRLLQDLVPFLRGALAG